MTHFISRDTKTESEGMEEAIPSKKKSKETWISNIQSDEIDFKIKTVLRDKEGHYIKINHKRLSSHCGSVIMSPTSIHEDVGSIPVLTQWVKDPALS